MSLFFFPAYSQCGMSSMFHEIYIYGSEIYFILLLFFWKSRKKETLSQILSLFYWQHEIVLLSQRLIRKKKSLIKHQRKCRIITTASNILSFSNNKQCALLQETNVLNWIDKSIKTSGLFALAKKQTEKYSVCGWSQTVLVTVSFTRNRAAFSGPLALSTNTLRKLATESERLAEELSIWGEEEHKTLTVFSV